MSSYYQQQYAEHNLRTEVKGCIDDMLRNVVKRACLAEAQQDTAREWESPNFAGGFAMYGKSSKKSKHSSSKKKKSGGMKKNHPVKSEHEDDAYNAEASEDAKNPDDILQEAGNLNQILNHFLKKGRDRPSLGGLTCDGSTAVARSSYNPMTSATNPSNASASRTLAHADDDDDDDDTDVNMSMLKSRMNPSAATIPPSNQDVPPFILCYREELNQHVKNVTKNKSESYLQFLRRQMKIKKSESEYATNQHKFAFGAFEKVKSDLMNNERKLMKAIQDMTRCKNELTHMSTIEEEKEVHAIDAITAPDDEFNTWNIRNTLLTLHTPARPPRKKKNTHILKTQTQPFSQTVLNPPPLGDLKGPNHLVASALPDNFPPELSFRALSSYALIRTFSLRLRVSPFTPVTFLRALSLPIPSRLLGDIHVSILRYLFASISQGKFYMRGDGGAMGHGKGGRLSNEMYKNERHARAGENLFYMNAYTWPMFLDDYASLTVEGFLVDGKEGILDGRSVVMRSGPEAEEMEIGVGEVELMTELKPKTRASKRPLGLKLTGKPKIDASFSEDDEDREPDEDDEYLKQEDPSDSSSDEDFVYSKKSSKVSSGSTPNRPGRPRGRREDKPGGEPSPAPAAPPPESLPPSPHPTHPPSLLTHLQPPPIPPVPPVKRKRGRPRKNDPAPPKPPPTPLPPGKKRRGRPRKSDTPKVAQVVRSPRGSEGSGPTLRAVVPRPVVEEVPILAMKKKGRGRGKRNKTPWKTREREEEGPEGGRDESPRAMVAGGAGYQQSYVSALAAAVGMKTPQQQQPMAPHPSSVAPQPDSQVVTAAPVAHQAAPQSAPPMAYQTAPQAAHQAASQSAPPTVCQAAPQAAYQAASPAAPPAAPHRDPPAVPSSYTPASSQPPPASGYATTPSYAPPVAPTLAPPPPPPAPAPTPLPAPSAPPPAPKSLPPISRPTPSQPPPPTITDTTAISTIRDYLTRKVPIAHSSNPPSSSSNPPSRPTTPSPLATLIDDLPHNAALAKLRSGCEYRLLSIADKLSLLEFLLDQLSQTPLFSQDLSNRRQTITSYPYTFAPLPSREELENLTNVDECVVCGLEGELLCCDGCTASYHRKCVNLPPEGELPPGKWLCVECKVADPSKLGPLRGGSKPNLEWFRLKDLAEMYEEVERLKMSNEDDGEWNVVEADQRYGYSSSLALATEVDGRPVWERDTRQFMVIHGFVFTRDESSPGSEMPKPPVPLSPEELYSLLQSLGPLGLKWPFCQIPYRPTETWSAPTSLEAHCRYHAGYNAGAKEYYVEYSCSPVSYNPTLYVNLYKQAPWSPLIAARSSVLTPIHDDVIKMFSNVIFTRDASEDSKICQLLLNDRAVFDPLLPLKQYLLLLEKTLCKSLLLDEMWGVNKMLIPNLWRERVVRCRSVRKLARCLVRLVDAAHCRCFFEEWNRYPGWVKRAMTQKQTRVFNEINEDWTDEKEQLRRKWERCNQTGALKLLLDEGIMNAGLSKDVGRKKRKDKQAVNVTNSPASFILNGLKDISHVDSLATSNSDTHITSDSNQNPTQSPQTPKPPKKSTPTQKKPSPTITTTPPQAAPPPTTPKSAPPPSSTPSTTPLNGSNKKKKRRRTDFSEPANRRRSTRVEKQKPLKTEFDNLIEATLQSQSSTTHHNQNNPYSHHYPSLLSTTHPFPLSDKPNSRLTTSEQIQKVRYEKICELERLLIEPYTREGHWPVCGRKLFEPEGSLPPKVVRRLGRNAGKVYAPFVTYASKFEVGQVSVGHCWRKRTLVARTMEELCLQIKVLESYLNRSSISTCESLARRSASTRATILRVIKCSVRDYTTGTQEHFVISKSKQRGTWLSEEIVEHSALLILRAANHETRTKAFQGKVTQRNRDVAETKEREKRDTDKKGQLEDILKTSVIEAEEAQRAMKLAQGVVEEKCARFAEAKRFLEETNQTAAACENFYEQERKRLADEREKKRQAKKEADAKKAAERAAESRRKKQEAAERQKKADDDAKSKRAMAQAETRRVEQMQKMAAGGHYMNHQGGEEPTGMGYHSSSGGGRGRGGRDGEMEIEGKYLEDFNKAVIHHEQETKRLLRESAENGLSTVPMEKMNAARLKSMEMMKKANDVLRGIGSSQYIEESQLTDKLASAEEVGVSLYVKELEEQRKMPEQSDGSVTSDNLSMVAHAAKNKKNNRRGQSKQSHRQRSEDTGQSSYDTSNMYQDSNRGPSPQSQYGQGNGTEESMGPSMMQLQQGGVGAGGIDLSTLASLPPSMQRQLLQQFPSLQEGLGQSTGQGMMDGGNATDLSMIQEQLQNSGQYLHDYEQQQRQRLYGQNLSGYDQRQELGQSMKQNFHDGGNNQMPSSSSSGGMQFNSSGPSMSSDAAQSIIDANRHGSYAAEPASMSFEQYAGHVMNDYQQQAAAQSQAAAVAAASHGYRGAPAPSSSYMDSHQYSDRNFLSGPSQGMPNAGSGGHNYGGNTMENLASLQGHPSYAQQQQMSTHAGMSQRYHPNQMQQFQSQQHDTSGLSALNYATSIQQLIDENENMEDYSNW